MCLIAIQPYIKVIRQVTRTMQENIEDKRYIYLYRDKLVTKYREFPIEDVFDMSYRAFGKKGRGLLYIHTRKGVFSYTVKTSPVQFIASFNEHMKNK